MKEPTTDAEEKIIHNIRQSDPQRYLKIVEGWLSENPNSYGAYFGRHFAWINLGEPLKALDDVNRALALNPHPLAYYARAEVFRHLGEYRRALDDFARSEAIMPEEWEDLAFGLLSQADCHARLGDDEKALACCARLPEDFWTPGLNDAPAGDKTAISESLKLIAVQARRERT
jgi:tetratricopeptide (TPR) repeat protein